MVDCLAVNVFNVRIVLLFQIFIDCNQDRLIVSYEEKKSVVLKLAKNSVDFDFIGSPAFFCSFLQAFTFKEIDDSTLAIYAEHAPKANVILVLDLHALHVLLMQD